MVTSRRVRCVATVRRFTPEMGRQLDGRRALAVLRHQIVDLLRAKEGLSHPK